ncbi:MAG TPA: hypothetical protein VMN36_12370, partial [Verrucomicrobiales bacterium]|nr:hypothetical protein [Verrucomicrobiales bacterium]
EDRIAFLDVEYASLRRTALELQELLSREHEVNEELAEYVGKLRGEVEAMKNAGEDGIRVYSSEAAR